MGWHFKDFGSILGGIWEPKSIKNRCQKLIKFWMRFWKAKRWLFQAFVGPRDVGVEKARWVNKLIGLGPGLTPSGDDFLGGMMIALHAIGEHGLCSQLWPEIYQSAAVSTNPISFTHLKAASEGMGSKCIHRAISDMTGGNAEAMFGSMVGINRIGHTSGWDTVAGIVLTFEVWLQARGHQKDKIVRG